MRTNTWVQDWKLHGNMNICPQNFNLMPDEECFLFLPWSWLSVYKYSSTLSVPLPWLMIWYLYTVISLSWDLNWSRTKFTIFLSREDNVEKGCILPHRVCFLLYYIYWSILMSNSIRGLVGLGLTQEFPGISPPIELEFPIHYLNDLAPCCCGAWTVAELPQW